MYSILIYNKTLIQMPIINENYESIHVYADNYSKNWYEKTNRYLVDFYKHVLFLNNNKS